MTARRSRSPLANRILIGAITALVATIAVFLAYNANSGLPFVPSYDLDAQLPDAAGLTPMAGVLIGGTRVGYVGSISAARLPGGQPIAIAHLHLDESVGPLPVDSTDLVRPVSPLGEDYLQITVGHALRTLPAGATIPLSHTRAPVQIDQLFGMFDAPTRRAARANLDTFGDAFAGRGADLNRALGRLEPLARHAADTAADLLAPSARWARLFPALEHAAHEVAGVASAQAQLIGNLDLTFTPLAQASGSLQAAIAGGPPALRTAARELPAQARFVEDATALAHRLRPALGALGRASDQLAPAEAAGIPALARVPALNARLLGTLAALERFAEDGRTLPGLALLTETATLLEPTIAFAAPAQTRCNYLALFFRDLESALSESDQVGSELNVLSLPLPQLPDSEAGPSSRPANGPPASRIPGLTPAQRVLVDDSFLHSDPYPDTAAPGQPAQCEAGNERYVPGLQAIGAAPVTQRTTEPTRRVLP